MNEQQFAELAAGHALNALSVDDERAYADALLAHPEWNEIVAQDAATAAALGSGVAQVSPPVGARGVLLSLIARTPQAPPRPPVPASETAADTAAPGASDATRVETHEVEASDLSLLQPPTAGETREAPVAESVPVEPTPTDVVQTVARRRWMRGLFALAASLALLVTLGFGAALINQQVNRTPAQIALDRIEDAPDAQTATAATDAGGEATAHWSPSLGQAVLVTDGLPELASGETYQLWFVRADETIDSGGLFATNAVGESTSLWNGDLEAGDVLAVSVEPSGGSDQPTTTPILLIPTTA